MAAHLWKTFLISLFIFFTDGIADFPVIDGRNIISAV